MALPQTKIEVKPVIGDGAAAKNKANSDSVYTQTAKETQWVDMPVSGVINPKSETDSTKEHRDSSLEQARLKYDKPLSKETNDRIKANIEGKPHADYKPNFQEGESIEGNKKYLNNAIEANKGDEKDRGKGVRVDQILPVERTPQGNENGLKESKPTMKKYEVIFTESGKKKMATTSALNEEEVRTKVMNKCGIPAENISSVKETTPGLGSADDPNISKDQNIFTEKPTTPAPVTESKNKKKEMHLIYSRTEFLNEEHMLRLIPESYKVDGKEVVTKDMNGSTYLVEWKTNEDGKLDAKITLREGTFATSAQQKNRMFELMGYSPKKYMTQTTVESRINEDKLVKENVTRLKG